MLPAVLLAQSGGCSEDRRVFHKTFGWQAEKFFDDPKVIELCKAIEANDLARIDRVVADGANVNAKGKGNMTPLLWAFPDGKFSRFQRLLEHGADPNVPITSDLGVTSGLAVGDSVTFLCAKTHYAGYFEAVIKHGGKPNLRNGEGKPLIFAIITAGLPDADSRIRLAVTSGADINLQDQYGDTPLMSSIIWFQQYQLAVAILTMGADPTIYKSNSLINALHCVIMAESDLHMFTAEQRAAHATLLVCLEKNGYDIATARKDLDRWNNWAKKDPSNKLYGRMSKKEIAEREAREIEKKKNGDPPPQPQPKSDADGK